MFALQNQIRLQFCFVTNFECEWERKLFYYIHQTKLNIKACVRHIFQLTIRNHFSGIDDHLVHLYNFKI